MRGTPDRLVTLAVIRDTVVAGETWVRIENTSPFRFLHCVFDGQSWFANREDGLYRWQTARNTPSGSTPSTVPRAPRAW